MTNTEEARSCVEIALHSQWTVCVISNAKNIFSMPNSHHRFHWTASRLISLTDTAFRRTFSYVRAVKDVLKEISALSLELDIHCGLLDRLHLFIWQLDEIAFHLAVQGHQIVSFYQPLEKIKAILPSMPSPRLDMKRYRT